METYQSFSKPMRFVCADHGEFYESPTVMYNTDKGCPDCGKLLSLSKRTKDIKTRKDEAVLKFGNKYDYSEVIGKISSKEVFFITCNKHNHRFETTWNRHLVKDGLGGCTICYKERMREIHVDDTEDFIRKSKSVHGDRYDYSQSIYISHKELVEIGCKEHGFFWQRADKHKIGQGCDKCVKNGFRNDKPGRLYVLEDNSRVKVGITNRKVSTRVSEINIGGGSFKVVEEFYYPIGLDCRNHETELLKMMRGVYKNTEGNFDGVTESFENVDTTLVLDFIKKIRETYDKNQERE